MGLLSPAGRTPAGYRQYDAASLQRLRFIARAKGLGCTLDEIRDLIAAWDSGPCAHVQDRLRATVDAKVAAARQRIGELTALTTDLRRAATILDTEAAPGACDDSCACLSDGPASVADLREAGPAGGHGDDEPVIACSLRPGDIVERVEEWHHVLDGGGDPAAGVVARYPVDDGVRLELGPRTDTAAVARLAAAEQGCCAFFRFALTIDARGVALEVRALEAAAEMVTALFGAAA